MKPRFLRENIRIARTEDFILSLEKDSYRQNTHYVGIHTPTGKTLWNGVDETLAVMEIYYRSTVYLHQTFYSALGSTISFAVNYET